VADYFIDLGEIADKVRKEPNHNHAPRYYDNHSQHDDPHTTQPPGASQPNGGQPGGAQPQHANGGQSAPNHGQRAPAAPAGSDEASVAEPSDPDPEPVPQIESHSDFIRVTDDH
jgi:hypothetical protein